MKHLLIILLMSVLSCVFNFFKKNNTNIGQLKSYLFNSQRIMDNIIIDIHIARQKEYKRYFPNKDYEKQLILIDELLKSITDYEIPTTKTAAEKLQYQWKKTNRKALDLAISSDVNYEQIISISDDNYESIINTFNYSTSYFHHSNPEFRQLLADIRATYFQINHIIILNVFERRGSICRFNPTTIFNITSKPLKKNHLSKLGFTFINYKNKMNPNIRKLWINDQLVFEKTVDNLTLPEKLNLIYDGIDKYRVKVAIKESYDSPVFYQERTFDFQNPSCN